MIFTIEAVMGPLGWEGSFRLRKNGTWREQNDFPDLNREEDMCFPTFVDAKTWLTQNTQVEIDGEEYNTAVPTEAKLGDSSNYHFQIMVHRQTKPNVFTYSDVERVIRSGNDDVYNSLIIDFEGIPGLVQLDDINDGRGNYAVRFETFCAGNGYVGRDTSGNHINDTYIGLLEGWCTHLKCGKSIYFDFVDGAQSESELLGEIEELTDNLPRNLDN